MHKYQRELKASWIRINIIASLKKLGLLGRPCKRMPSYKVIGKVALIMETDKYSRMPIKIYPKYIQSEEKLEIQKQSDFDLILIHK